MNYALSVLQRAFEIIAFFYGVSLECSKIQDQTEIICFNGEQGYLDSPSNPCI